MRFKILVLFVVLGFMAACGGAPSPPAETPPAEPAAPAEPSADVDGPGYTETPALDKIPEGTIKGMANGRPFEATGVYFEPSFGKWRLVIGDKPLEEPTDIVVGAQAVNMDIPEPPAAGKTWTRTMKYGDGYFQVKKTDDPENTTSWNADNAWVLELTKWDVQPYDENGSLFQQAGTASGKVYVAYKGSMDIKDSWVAGTFTDVPVRYMGKPELEY